MAKFVVVGIDDPYGKTPLQPDILNSSGQKLWGMTGLTMVRYAQLFERYNLFDVDESHNMKAARFKAMNILVGINTRYVNTYVICLGRAVAGAFGLYDATPLQFKEIKNKVMAAYVPHTSGVNRWYNDPSNVRAATEFMQSVGAVAVGELDEYLINPSLFEEQSTILCS